MTLLDDVKHIQTHYKDFFENLKIDIPEGWTQDAPCGSVRFTITMKMGKEYKIELNTKCFKVLTKRDTGRDPGETDTETDKYIVGKEFESTEQLLEAVHPEYQVLLHYLISKGL
eukprot:GHVR01180236.1.p1 GENE.GHVR01180236.1~~GHVR01180236.1.p1  ORF type:complete len:114 (-),score=15.58 GHVR01180236.1:352-693(-)